MIYKRKRIVVALGGNALGNTLPEQMIAVKSTAKALCDLIEEGHQVVVVHGNGPQVGMINNAMTALTHEDQAQPNTPPLCLCSYEPGLHWLIEPSRTALPMKSVRQTWLHAYTGCHRVTQVRVRVLEDSCNLKSQANQLVNSLPRKKLISRQKPTDML